MRKIFFSSYNTEHMIDAIGSFLLIFLNTDFEDDEEFITIEVLVDESVIGSVIGKKGVIANAIRTIVQASSYANGLKKVKINIDSF